MGGMGVHMTTLYKVTDKNGGPCHGGTGKWPLPNGAPGAWLEVTGDLVPCWIGLHLCRKKDLIEWLGPCIWAVEYEGEMVECDDKIVVRKARLLHRYDRWTDQTARLLAADCAERVLKIANNPRCDAAVKAARMFAFGLIDDAAKNAAWVAAKNAAWVAAEDAAWGPGGASAAWDAAGVAARSAEREWQGQRLHAYLHGHVDLDAIRDVLQ